MSDPEILLLDSNLSFSQRFQVTHRKFRKDQIEDQIDGRTAEYRLGHFL